MSSSANPDGPRLQQDRGPHGSAITRRSALAGAALVGVGIGVERALSGPGSGSEVSADPRLIVPFHGRHQAGIATAPQRHLHFAAFDVRTGSRSQLARLLERWTDAATALTAGRVYLPAGQGPLSVPTDPGEAVGLSPARLTLTFGFGPTLFESDGVDRYGLARYRPPVLEALPPFRGDALDPRRSGGDLCVQACADDPQVAFHAVHVLSRLAGADASLRWAQTGFVSSNAKRAGETPRNLIGFKDGTDNIRGDDRRALDEFVWLGNRDNPAWLRGGTYLIVRRIEIVLSTWDSLTLTQQEHTIGRHKYSGAPLGTSRERDPVDLSATDSHGVPIIPLDAHIRLASPSRSDGQRMLRRSYSFSDGTTPPAADSGGDHLDAGLFFIAFVRDPSRQFIPIQRRLAAGDALGAFTVHTSSAVFACPPGIRTGDVIGQRLFT